MAISNDLIGDNYNIVKYIQEICESEETAFTYLSNYFTQTKFSVHIAWEKKC